MRSVWIDVVHSKATNNSRFLFNDQVYDNVFWSCTSGVAIWTAYEAIMLQSWATNPEASGVYFDWWSRPVYSAAWLLAGDEHAQRPPIHSRTGSRELAGVHPLRRPL